MFAFPSLNVLKHRMSHASARDRGMTGRNKNTALFQALSFFLCLFFILMQFFPHTLGIVKLYFISGIYVPTIFLANFRRFFLIFNQHESWLRLFKFLIEATVSRSLEN